VNVTESINYYPPAITETPGVLIEPVIKSWQAARSIDQHQRCVLRIHPEARPHHRPGQTLWLIGNRVVGRLRNHPTEYGERQGWIDLKVSDHEEMPPVTRPAVGDRGPGA